MSANDPKRTSFSLIREDRLLEASGPGDTSHDPAELTRLLAGGLQGENEECSPRYWAPLLILEIVEPATSWGPDLAFGTPP